MYFCTCCRTFSLCRSLVNKNEKVRVVSYMCNRVPRKEKEEKAKYKANCQIVVVDTAGLTKLEKYLLILIQTEAKLTRQRRSSQTTTSANG